MNPEDEKWEDYERDHAPPYDPWDIPKPFAPSWSRFIVRSVEGEAESEKIFYALADAQNFAEQQLARGTCAHVIEQPVDNDDIPF
tara:strand:- start:5107 stop:5361 length:255 start_codon:yes stop_codon:yes gene_type:complete